MTDGQGAVVVGYVHVGRYIGPHAPMTGKWKCADDCPHPDHDVIAREGRRVNE